MRSEIGKTKLEYAFFGLGGYLDRCQKSGGYSKNTIRAKRVDLFLFLDFVMKTNPTPTLNAVTAEVLLMWIAHISSNCSPATTRRRMNTLKHFWNVLQKEYQHPAPLTKWPSVNVTPPRIPRIDAVRLKQVRDELRGRDFKL